MSPAVPEQVSLFTLRTFRPFRLQPPLAFPIAAFGFCSVRALPHEPAGFLSWPSPLFLRSLASLGLRLSLAGSPPHPAESAPQRIPVPALSPSSGILPGSPAGARARLTFPVTYNVVFLQTLFDGVLTVPRPSRCFPILHQRSSPREYLIATGCGRAQDDHRARQHAAGRAPITSPAAAARVLLNAGE